MQDFLDHPQLEARGRWHEVGSPVGPLRALIPPATMAGVEPVMASVPGVGEHTDGILEELGYDGEAVAALHREGPGGGRVACPAALCPAYAIGLAVLLRCPKFEI